MQEYIQQAVTFIVKVPCDKKPILQVVHYLEALTQSTTFHTLLELCPEL